jgi:hypothetical protein
MKGCGTDFLVRGRVMELVFAGFGVFFILAAVSAILAETFTQHRWPRITLLPGGIAMIVGVLLLAAAA